jgi:ribosome biogenesis protein MAK21
MYQLLAGNPEQEQLLLERLVNKLGDPTRTVAAKAMYHLTLLLGNRIFRKRSVKSSTVIS